MELALLDSSFVVALQLTSDQNHRAATEQWTRLEDAPHRLVTTWLIVSEIVTFLSSRGSHDRAVTVGNELLNSDLVKIIPLDIDLLNDGGELFCAHADKTYSLADCVSFVVMQRMRVRQAWTFDRHFEQAGFIRRP